MIINDEGGNRKVETKRGKLFHAPCDEVECLDEVDGEEPTEPEMIAAVDCDHE